MIDRDTVARIMDRADIVDVVGDFVALKRHGKDFIGLCPFHDDTRPSFNVSTTKNICKCFACGEGGTPISFIEKYLHLSFPEAIKYLGKKYGIPVAEREQSPEERRARSEREELLAANSFARDAFVTELHNGNEGRIAGLKYFRDRGLTDETIEKFELGYSPRDRHFLSALADKEGHSREVLERAGLLFRTDDGDYIDRYRDRVIYPIHSLSGTVVGFGGRVLVKKENTGKYINSPASVVYDKSRELYGLYFAKQSIAKKDRCLVVEGYMDVLSMHQRGITNVVASSGTALTVRQVQMIHRLTTHLTFIFDADAAGIKAALRGLDIGLEQGMSLTTVLLPEGEDPDSFARAHSAEEIEQYITEHEEDSLRFNARILSEQNGSDTPQGKVETLQAIAESMAHIGAKGTLDIYIEDLAPRLGVLPDHLRESIAEIRDRRRKAAIRERQFARQREQMRQEERQPAAAPEARPAAESAAEPPDRLNPFEVTLLRDILRYGFVEIPDYEYAPGQRGCTLIRVIRHETQDLRDAEILTTHFCTILDDAERLYGEQRETDLAKALSWHEDEVIHRAVSDLITHDEQLTDRMHRAFLSEYSEPGEVMERVLKTILSFKYDYILRQISDVLLKLKAIPPEEQSGERELSEETAALLARHEELIRMKTAMSTMLGNRTLTPTLRLQPRHK